jgi:hypothetical protein
MGIGQAAILSKVKYRWCLYKVGNANDLSTQQWISFSMPRKHVWLSGQVCLFREMNISGVQI